MRLKHNGEHFRMSELGAGDLVVLPTLSRLRNTQRDAPYIFLGRKKETVMSVVESSFASEEKMFNYFLGPNGDIERTASEWNIELIARCPA